MKGNPIEDKDLVGLTAVWRAAQTKPAHVTRWEDVQEETTGEEGESAYWRRQTLLAHTSGIMIVAGTLLPKLRMYHEINPEMVLIALAVRMHGRAERGLSKPYPYRSQEDDLAEYEAFMGRFSQHDDTSRRYFRRCYLLQRALAQDNDLFPAEEQGVIRMLAQGCRNEAFAFLGIELADYLLYGWEHLAQGRKAFLRDTVHNIFDQLDWVAEELPGYRKVFWTDAVRGWHEDFRANNDRVLPIRGPRLDPGALN